MPTHHHRCVHAGAGDRLWLRVRGTRRPGDRRDDVYAVGTRKKDALGFQICRCDLKGRLVGSADRPRRTGTRSGSAGRHSADDRTARREPGKRGGAARTDANDYAGAGNGRRTKSRPRQRKLSERGRREKA